MLGTLISAVGKQGPIFVIQQFFKDLAVMHTGRRGAGAQDELGFQLGFHMVLPAVVRFVVLPSPACLAFFLAAHGRVGVELLGAFALLDELVLIAVVAPTRGYDKTGVDDAALRAKMPLPWWI